MQNRICSFRNQPLKTTNWVIRQRKVEQHWISTLRTRKIQQSKINKYILQAQTMPPLDMGVIIENEARHMQICVKKVFIPKSNQLLLCERKLSYNNLRL